MKHKGSINATILVTCRLDKHCDSYHSNCFITPFLQLSASFRGYLVELNDMLVQVA